MSRGKNWKDGQARRRLVGWLVSYALDEKGKSYEIRAGRHLVSSQGLSGDTEVIEVSGRGIAAPHLALSATTKHTLLVQDIFTDQGSFIIKSGSDKERRIGGPTPVEHGDWIRIGDNTRFQVCLIDGGGR